MRTHSDPQYARLVRDLLKKNWTNVPGKKHYKMRSPGGHLLVLPMSSSCARAYQNTLRNLAKIEKEESEQS